MALFLQNEEVQQEKLKEPLEHQEVQGHKEDTFSNKKHNKIDKKYKEKGQHEQQEIQKQQRGHIEQQEAQQD